MADTLFFIPDISGFTEFVHSTEVRHSNHIVGELLELLIEQNELGLTAAEIEGDAVLFYKQGDIPDTAAILKQAEDMFIAFHEHLAYYNQRRVCDCGACRTASGLSLKIVVHRGEAEMLKVKQFVKPFGSAVIVAHRLMKNTVPLDEYLLMTEPVFQKNELNSFHECCSWGLVKQGTDAYTSIGETAYYYVNFENLHEQVPHPPPPPVWTQQGDKFATDIEIACPPIHVYTILTTLSRRQEFQKGLRGFEYKKNEVNRIGSEHVCILPFGKSTFETVRVKNEGSTREYAETTRDIPFIKEMTQLFSLEESSLGTRVVMNTYMQPKNWLGRTLSPIYKKTILKGMEAMMADLKAVCEAEIQKEEQMNIPF